MIAVDTNIIVYAHRRDSEWHEASLRCLRSLAEGPERWAIPWPCIHEFLAIVTHPRIYSPPTPLATAFAAIDVWLGCPTCTAIGEGPGYLERLQGLVVGARAAGGLVHDARVAALCLHHGVSELWSSDRDFSRFPELSITNPLLSPR